MDPDDEEDKLILDIPDTVWNIQSTNADITDISEYPSFDELVGAISRITKTARDIAAQQIVTGQLWACWNSGRMIVAYEQGGRDRAEYGDRTLARLSKRLTSEIG